MPRIIIHPDGTREIAEEATASDPRGDAPRTVEGLVIGTDGLPVGAAETPAHAAVAPRALRKPRAPRKPAAAALLPAEAMTPPAPQPAEPTVTGQEA